MKLKLYRFIEQAAIILCACIGCTFIATFVYSFVHSMG